MALSAVHTEPNCAIELPSVRTMCTVAFLGVTAGVLLMDNGLQAVLLSAIQTSFGISDAMLGMLQGLAGVLVGSALAVPLARLSDRFSRKRVLLSLIVVSTALLVLCALAPNFPLFFLGRSAGSVTEFVMVPLVYSMIPDLVPERYRVPANLSFAALMAVGASSGFYFSVAIITFANDWITLDLAPWRKAFLLLSGVGLPLWLLGCMSVDPPRRQQVAQMQHDACLWQFWQQRRRAVLAFVGAAGCLLVAVQALNQLVALALERRFAPSVGTIGHVLGLIVLLTSVGCLPFAGALDHWLGARFDRAVRPFIMGICALLALLILTWLSCSSSLREVFVAIAVYGFLTSTANALVPTMLQDLAPAILRARVFAVWSFVVSLFSASGPLVAGALSSYVFAGHMLQAIVVTAAPALVLSILCSARSFRLARDAVRKTDLATPK